MNGIRENEAVQMIGKSPWKRLVPALFAAVLAGLPPPLAALPLRVPAPAASALAAPTLSAVAGNGVVELSWTKSRGADHYQYRMSVDGGASWRRGWWPVGVGSLEPVRNLRAVGLTNGTAYTFQVRAVETSYSLGEGRTTTNYSEPSNAVTATPTE